MAKAKKKSRSISLSFKGVDTSRRETLEEGTYNVSVAEAEMDESAAGNDMLKVTFAVEDSTAKLYENFPLSKTAMWKLGQFLIAAGYDDVEDEDLDLDLDELIDSELTVEVAHETYEGKKRAKIIDFIPSEEEEEPEPEPKKGKKGKAKEEAEEEEEEEEKAPKKGKGSKKKANPEPVSVEAVQEADEDELQEIVDGAGIEIDLDEFPTLRKARSAVIDALEEAGLIEEAEEEEKPKGKKKK